MAAVMQRKNYYLPKTLLKRFDACAKRKGISASELLRRIIEQFLDDNQE